MEILIAEWDGTTDPRYWDCECENDFIHKKSEQKWCRKCKAGHLEQPDSRPNEIAIHYPDYKRITR